MTYIKTEEKKDAFEHLINQINKYAFTLLMILISGVLVLKALESQALNDTYYEAINITANVDNATRTIKKEFNKKDQKIINTKCSFPDVTNETPKQIKNLLMDCKTQIKANEATLKAKGNESIDNLLKSLNFAIESAGNLVKEISIKKNIENVTLSYFRDPSKSISEQNKIQMASENTLLFGVTLNLLLTIYVLPILQLLTLLILTSYLSQLRFFIESQNYIQPHQLLFQKKIFWNNIGVGKILLILIALISMAITFVMCLMFYKMISNITPFQTGYIIIVNILIILLSISVFYYTFKIPENVSDVSDVSDVTDVTDVSDVSDVSDVTDVTDVTSTTSTTSTTSNTDATSTTITTITTITKNT